VRGASGERREGGRPTDLKMASNFSVRSFFLRRALSFSFLERSATNSSNICSRSLSESTSLNAWWFEMNSAAFLRIQNEVFRMSEWRKNQNREFSYFQRVVPVIAGVSSRSLLKLSLARTILILLSSFSSRRSSSIKSRKACFFSEIVFRVLNPSCEERDFRVWSHDQAGVTPCSKQTRQLLVGYG